MRRFSKLILFAILGLLLAAVPAAAQDWTNQILTYSSAGAQATANDAAAYQVTWSDTSAAQASAIWAEDNGGEVLSTSHYDLHYGSWSSVATALTNYLDSAYSTASGILGYDNGGNGKIDIYFYSEPDSSTSGYTYIGDNALYLNIRGGADTSSDWLSDYGATVSHETSHVLFEHKTGMGSVYSPSQVGFYAVTWLTESIAFYTSEVAYTYGARYSKSTLGYNLMLVSGDGANRTSWWGTGYNYQTGWYTSLDLIQLYSIGAFLIADGGGSSLARLTSSMAASKDFEGAFMDTYGMYTGQFSTDSGDKVGTLYSEYLNYYLGHY